MARRRKTGRVALGFLLELCIYTVLVVVYFFLVLHLLGGWLEHLFLERRVAYAVVSLALILGQGVLLEALTSALFRLHQRHFRE